MAGMKMMEIKKSAMMLIPATTPNSFSTALLVRPNTAKPMAAVILQKSVTTPMRLIISVRAASFLLPSNPGCAVTKL
jgi:hypothetical protein